MNENNDELKNFNLPENRLPTGLNVLTILTFIWSPIAIIFSVVAFVTAKTTYETKDKVIAQMSNGALPSWMKSIMPDMTHFEEMATKSYENRIPIAILGIIGILLCFWGAIEMRKRKKQGFLFYTIGSILPFVTSALFIGIFAITGGAAIFSIALTLLFIGLYAIQRKHLS